MTTLFDKVVQCCICGEKSTHMSIGSTNSFGSSDLDTRQPEMQRSTIYHWIQRCPKCGYCASDLSECIENTKEIVNSKEYQNISGSAEMPEKAASFLAQAYELEMQQAYSDAAWQVIHAAWICDDNNDLKSSTKCRKQAIALIEKAKNYDQIFIDQLGASEAITIDLMRRSGMLQQALDLAEAIKKEDIEEIIMKLIQYQEVLIANNDIAAHLISEAIGEK